MAGGRHRLDDAPACKHLPYLPHLEACPPMGRSACGHSWPAFHPPRQHCPSSDASPSLAPSLLPPPSFWLYAIYFIPTLVPMMPHYGNLDFLPPHETLLLQENPEAAFSLWKTSHNISYKIEVGKSVNIYVNVCMVVGHRHPVGGSGWLLTETWSTPPTAHAGPHHPIFNGSLVK